MIDDEPEEKGKKSEAKEEKPKEADKEPKEKALVFPDGTAVAADGLGIHWIEGGKRHWIPDTWTQTYHNIAMDEVVILFPNQLLAIPEGDPIPSLAPKEPLF